MAQMTDRTRDATNPARTRPRRPLTTRPGLTSVETLLFAAALGFVGLLLALGTSSIRDELKRKQTHDMLLVLDRALALYHDTTDQWPEAAPAEPVASTAHRNPSRDVLAALLTVPASSQVLNEIPAILWANAGMASSANATQVVLQDAWGREVRCLTLASASESDRQLVEANGRCPVFLSAGPDGRFGDKNASDAADDIMLQPNPER